MLVKQKLTWSLEEMATSDFKEQCVITAANQSLKSALRDRTKANYVTVLSLTAGFIAGQ